MGGLIDKILEDPTVVFSGNLTASKDAMDLVKEYLDPIASGNSVLDEIYTDGLDSSQVWGQVKLVIDGVNDKLLGEEIPVLKEKFGSKLDDEAIQSADEFHSAEDMSELSAEESADDLSLPEQADQDSEEFSEEEEGDGEQFSEEEEQEDEEEVPEEASKEPEEPKVKKDKFGLNDGFFDIDEFNRQVLAQEDNNNDNDDDDEEIDYFGDLSEEDDEDDEVAYYGDFFKNSKPQTQKKNVKLSKKDEEQYFDDDGELLEAEYDKAYESAKMDLFADEEEEVVDTKENLSTFEKQQREIQKEIAQLEQEAVAEKKWTLKGEAKAKDRPTDALLEEDLEFERTARPVPVITQEVTESIEDLIRRRIKEQNFDELERRLISDVAKFNRSKKFELSEEKSTKSLAEQYEDDYNGVAETSKTSEELEKAHAEISQLFQSLSHKLDSLSSAHFIPKPAQKALDIKVDTATITMEDAQPLTLSNASTLAPQELFNVKTGINSKEISLKSGLVMSKDELTREEKQRLRRLNKRKKAKEFKNKAPVKKSKKNEVIDTLSRAKNLTVINNKGEKRDAKGNLVKDSRPTGSSSLKL